MNQDKNCSVGRLGQNKDFRTQAEAERCFTNMIRRRKARYQGSDGKVHFSANVREAIKTRSLKNLNESLFPTLTDNDYLKNHTTHQQVTTAIPHLLIASDQADESSVPAFSPVSENIVDSTTTLPSESGQGQNVSLHCLKGEIVECGQIPYMPGQQLLLTLSEKQIAQLEKLMISCFRCDSPDAGNRPTLRVSFQVLSTNKSMSSVPSQSPSINKPTDN